MLGKLPSAAYSDASGKFLWHDWSSCRWLMAGTLKKSTKAFDSLGDPTMNDPEVVPIQISEHIVQTIAANVLLSIGAAYTTNLLIKQYIPIFIERKLYGVDQCKEIRTPVAEPMGVIAAAVYLIFMFLFI
uniref:Uncharacterized protein n=1 Tax=Panagrolaimus sp. JU765 TaxID=591449 RepID=A0AC34RS50_9BILA